MMNRKFRNAFALTLFILGILISMQIRTVIETNQGKQDVNIRVLASNMDAEMKQGLQYRQEISELEAERERLINRIGMDKGNTDIEPLLSQQNIELFRAGLTAVHGPGIVMTLNDAAVVGDFDLEDYIIHDSDIYPLLNELRVAGAQAISINNERVIATTKTVCAGPTILINQSRYPVPYEFKAIGDMQALYTAMENSEAVAVLRIYNIRVDLRMEKDMTIEKYQIFDKSGIGSAGLEVVKQ
jgi:uncharacterized protein YlxW (UPF0749 family)